MTEELDRAASSPPPPEGSRLYQARNVAPALTETLGSCLAPLGFSLDEGTSVKGVYRGSLAGRQVAVSSAIRSRTRYDTPAVSYRTYAGFLLEISVDTSLRTHFGASVPPEGSDNNVVVRGVATLFARLNGMRRLPYAHPDLGELRIFAFEPEWAQQVLSDEAVREALGGMTSFESLSFGPGKMTLLVAPPFESITPDAVERWLDDVLRLVTSAESKPTRLVARTTAFGKKIQQNPRAAILFGVLLLLALPFALGLFFLVGWLIMGEWVLIFPFALLFFVMPYGMFLVFRDWYRAARQRLR